MERINGALYLNEDQQRGVKGGLEPFIQPVEPITISLTGLSTCLSTSMSTCLSTLIAMGGSTCDHDSSSTCDFDTSSTAD